MRFVASGAARLLCATGFLFALVPCVFAQQAAQENSGRRTMVAIRLNAGESLVLDGRLDEPFWSRAVPAGDFRQVDPDNGRPATELTEVRIAFDADSLYMGVMAFDSDPDGVIASQKRRDETLPRLHAAQEVAARAA